MKHVRRAVLMAAALFFIGFPYPAVSQAPTTVLVVCRVYNVSRNCYKCSDYFSVDSSLPGGEDKAKRRCAKKGYDEPNYFKTTSQVQHWMLANCTCGDEEED